MPDLNTWVPNSSAQAMAMLDAAHDDLEQARRFARTNARRADADDNDSQFWYWIAVRDALIPEGVAQC